MYLNRIYKKKSNSMFIKNYKEFLFEVRDKKHEPAGENVEKDHKDGNHAGKDE